MKITETCACGASVTVEHARMESLAASTVDEWRRTHAHLATVGICGDKVPVVGGIRNLYCTLAHGHTGAHHDADNGGHWFYGSQEERP